MSASFAAKKRKILQSLEAPAGEYTDLSPKGSVDEKIRPLIEKINQIDGLVTTSSCAGRVSVFLEGKSKSSKTPPRPENGAERSSENLAGPGGKGGGAWLYVSHDELPSPQRFPDDYLLKVFGLQSPKDPTVRTPGPDARFIHLKFEAMILHILTASLPHAQRVLSAALQAGFRESGAVGLVPSADGSITPMVAVRSSGLGLDAIIGYQHADGSNISMVDAAYLRSMICILNEKFQVNLERIKRFHLSVCELAETPPRLLASSRLSSRDDTEVRRQRKREEGLQRQRQLAICTSKQEPAPSSDPLGDDDVESGCSFLDALNRANAAMSSSSDAMRDGLEKIRRWDSEQQATTDVLSLKQGDRSLLEYIDEARSILPSLPANQEKLLVRRFLLGLADTRFKYPVTVAVLESKLKSRFEDTVRIIKEVNGIMDPRIEHENESIFRRVILYRSRS